MYQCGPATLNSMRWISYIEQEVRDVVQSFGKIRYLVSVQDRGEGGGPGVILGKLKYKIAFFIHNILKLILNIKVSDPYPPQAHINIV